VIAFINWATDVQEEAEARVAALEEQNALMRKALGRIAAAKADGLDGARDTAVLERAIRIARSTLRRVGEP
jgi:hypothetical protein